ncbi:MAG: stage II sporulation protein P [Solirubrobacterales bacterium]
MRTRFPVILISLTFIVLGLLLFAQTGLLPISKKPLPRAVTVPEAPTGRYYTALSPKGDILFRTGLPVAAGDLFIDHDNICHRITRVRNWTASTEVVAEKPVDERPGVLASQLRANQALALNSPRVGIYHTHNDESFTPTQGTAIQPGRGAVYEVGDALSRALSQAGITVDHSYAAHDPHDANAYSRSRRTVFALLRKNPDALFDVHRDSAPSDEYFTYITGIESAKVMIVVGRQNPHMATNMAFARQVKAKADQVYPDLVRGIFIGHGSYNQDLHPRALLFEMSTDKLPEQLALDAARCLADVLSVLLRELPAGGVRGS